MIRKKYIFVFFLFYYPSQCYNLYLYIINIEMAKGYGRVEILLIC